MVYFFLKKVVNYVAKYPFVLQEKIEYLHILNGIYMLPCADYTIPC